MINGTAYGPRLSEIGNWVGKTIYAPRASVNKIMNFPKFVNSGIYCLKGDPNMDFKESLPNLPHAIHNNYQIISYYLRDNCNLEFINLIAMNRIKEVHEEQGFKQTLLAEKLGKSYNMVNS